MAWSLSANEIKRRQTQIREKLSRQDLAGLCVLNPTYESCLPGFAFIQTERPIAPACPRRGGERRAGDLPPRVRRVPALRYRARHRRSDRAAPLPPSGARRSDHSGAGS